MFVKHKCPDDCQFQRWSKSQEQISWYIPVEISCFKKCSCAMIKLIFILEVMTNVHWKKSSNVRVKRFSTNITILSQEIPMLNMKTLALTVEKLSIKSMFSESRSNSKVKVTWKKHVGTHGKVLSLLLVMRNIKALTLIVQILWARLKFLMNRSNSKVKITVSKIQYPRKVLIKGILVLYMKLKH